MSKKKRFLRLLVEIGGSITAAFYADALLTALCPPAGIIMTLGEMGVVLAIQDKAGEACALRFDAINRLLSLKKKKDDDEDKTPDVEEK